MDTNKFINKLMIKLFLTLILLLIPITTQASGMAVFPDHLNLNASGFQTLSITNPSQDVLLFEVYADEFKDLIEITPRSFTLESGGQKKVKVGLSLSTPPTTSDSKDDKNAISKDPLSLSKSPSLPPPLSKEGVGGVVMNTNLSVTASPLNQTDANVTIGTKIPLTLHLDPPPAPSIFKTLLYTLLFGLVILCLRFWYKIFNLFKKLSH
jgi:hypothetical protein